MVHFVGAGSGAADLITVRGARLLEEADVVIDFSTAAAMDALLAACTEKKLPLVLCTTGLSDSQLEKVQALSSVAPVLRSANMSVGVNLLMKLLKEAAAKLAPAGFDMEIVEKHHNRKIDAPSGTAIALGESMNEALGGEYHFVYDRSERHEKRDAKEIGISAVRGGTIVGEHEIIFAGQDEVITFKHTAFSRALFAKGAVEAAKYLAGKPAGRVREAGKPAAPPAGDGGSLRAAGRGRGRGGRVSLPVPEPGYLPGGKLQNP